MLPRRSFLHAAVATLLGWRGFAQTATPAPGKPGREQTVAALQAARLECLTSQAYFNAAAERAAADGFAKVAVLFRAAVQSDAIHAENFAKAIRNLKALPAGEPAVPQSPATTQENLAALLERITTRAAAYGDAAKTARAGMQTAAIKPFNWAKANLTDLAALLKSAQASLDASKSTAPFYVCAVCGHVVEKIDFKKCVVCFFSKDEYKQVN